MTKPKPTDDPAYRRRSPDGMFVSDREYEPEAFDLDVLRLLPEEGAMKGRYMHDAMSARQIKRALDPTLSSGYVGTRLRIMSSEGLVVALKVVGHSKEGRGWQRTQKGRDLAVRGTLAEEE